jgi:hypothetical protein
VAQSRKAKAAPDARDIETLETQTHNVLKTVKKVLNEAPTRTWGTCEVDPHRSRETLDEDILLRWARSSSTLPPGHGTAIAALESNQFDIIGLSMCKTPSA